MLDREIRACDLRSHPARSPGTDQARVDTSPSGSELAEAIGREGRTGEVPSGTLSAAGRRWALRSSEPPMGVQVVKRGEVLGGIDARRGQLTQVLLEAGRLGPERHERHATGNGRRRSRAPSW